MYKKKNILIIGGTGFLGFNLAKHCISRGWTVVSVSTSKPKKIRKLPDAMYVFLDISNKKSLKSLNKFNFDYVVNCSGHVDHNNYRKTYNSHYIGCVNLCDYFQNKKIKAFIQIGSSSEYGKSKAPQNESSLCRPAMIYGKSKLQSTIFLLEKYRKQKFPATILRFFQIYGPHQDENRFIPIIINKCLKNKKFNCSPGTQTRDFIYIDDAVVAIMQAIKTKTSLGKIINIGSGKPIILKKIIKMVVNLVNGGVPLYGKIKLRVDEPKRIYPNLRKAKKILKWSAKVSIMNGIKKTIKFYR